MGPLFAFTLILMTGTVGGLYVLRPVILKKLEQKASPKLLGPSSEEVEDLQDRTRRLEEVVMFDGDKAAFADALKAAEERGRASAPTGNAVELARMRLAEKRLEMRAHMNHIELDADNDLDWPWET